LMQNSPWEHELGTFLPLVGNAWIKSTKASMCFSNIQRALQHAKTETYTSKIATIWAQASPTRQKGTYKQATYHDQHEAFSAKKIPLMSIGPKHEQKEHIQHITHRLLARSQILITRSSQIPTSYLMSCQSHRAMCPLLDMRLLIGEHHATVYHPR
jgi:hypothetical protein